jgi:YesN/AraC family two-component response regulator
MVFVAELFLKLRKRTRNMKILYVEDETQAREALSKYLTRRFGKIFTASDGVEGFEIFKEQEADLVIVDLYMPNMDGLEMIQRIKKHSPKTYVIVTSAVEEVETILKGVNLGIDKYLLKPINPENLIEIVNTYRDQLEKTRVLEDVFTLETKKQMEDEIKRKFAAFLKAATGKGPSDVTVFINLDKIEIKAYDALTIMEKNMIDNIQNSVIIEQYRKMFYSINEKTICDLAQEIIGSGVKFNRLEVSVEEATNRIELEILK